MNEREAWKYINQLNEMIEWCECEELKAHYRDERERAGKIRSRFMNERINEYLADIKKGVWK